MCAPAALAVAQVGVAAAGAVGQHQSASAAANAQNAAAASNYKHQLQVRSRNWDRERFRYTRALTQYDSKLNENALAANRAYAGEQTKLNNIYKQASFKQQANLVKLVQGTGRVAAWRAGKSAQRLDNQIVGQFGRNQALQLSFDWYRMHSRLMLITLTYNSSPVTTKHMRVLLFNS